MLVPPQELAPPLTGTPVSAPVDIYVDIFRFWNSFCRIFQLMTLPQAVADPRGAAPSAPLPTTDQKFLNFM